MKTQISTTQTIKVIENFYEALFSKNPDAIAELFSDETDWFIPGNAELANWLGARKNRREIREFFELLRANVEPVTAEIQHILVRDDFGVAVGEFSSKMLKTGKVFESIFSAHFTVRDGLIVRYRLQEDSYGLVKALT